VEMMGRLIYQTISYYDHDSADNNFATISAAIKAAKILGGLPASVADMSEEKMKEYAELVRCYGALDLEATFIDGLFTDLEGLYNIPPEMLLEIRKSLPRRFWLLEDRLSIPVSDLELKPQLQKILEDGEIKDVRQLVEYTKEELQLLSDKFRSSSYTYMDDLTRAVNRLGLKFRVSTVNVEDPAS
jgi:hypothetical protein